MNGRKVYELMFHKNGHSCGKHEMNKGIKQTLTNCLIEHGRMNAKEAEDYI